MKNFALGLMEMILAAVTIGIGGALFFMASETGWKSVSIGIGFLLLINGVFMLHRGNKTLDRWDDAVRMASWKDGKS